MRHRLSGEHALCQTRIGLDREAQPLGKRGNRLLGTDVGTRNEQIHPQWFQVVSQVHGLGLSDGGQWRRRGLPGRFAMTY